MAVQVGSVENFGLCYDVNWTYVNDFGFFFFQDGRKREIYKLFIVSKDSLKAQVRGSLGEQVKQCFQQILKGCLFISSRSQKSRVSHQYVQPFFV